MLGIVNYYLNFVLLYQLLFISLCLCVTVRCAIVFNYVREYKVLYLLKQNAVIYTCFVAAFVCCVAFRVEWGVMN